MEPKYNKPKWKDKKFTKVIGKIMDFLVKIWVSLPIIFGILFPMIYMAPLIFSSWWLFGSFEHISWLNYYIILNYQNPAISISLYAFEIMIFVMGWIIFLTGLITLTQARLSGKKLVSTGIYKYIRHPQNVGILLIMLPFSLYVPFGRDIGIRFGEVLSWTFLGFLFTLTSLLEERKMIKKFGESYVLYSNKTGFFLPKLRVKHDEIQTYDTNNLEIKASFWKINNYFFLKVLLIYVLFLILMYFIVMVLGSYGLLLKTR
ncbi:MAG: methyltransferase family protein [Candidatus Hodarchaeota archaeon]